MAIITLEALNAAYTSLPTFKFRLSADVFVMVEVISVPSGNSITISEFTMPGTILLTLPLKTLRALSFMFLSFIYTELIFRQPSYNNVFYMNLTGLISVSYLWFNLERNVNFSLKKVKSRYVYIKPKFSFKCKFFMELYAI